jgi:membrane protein implicated in regulation of membrane protease activity
MLKVVLSETMLIAFMLRVILLSVTMLSVYQLCVLMLKAVMSVAMLVVLMLRVVLLIVVAPFFSGEVRVQQPVRQLASDPCHRVGKVTKVSILRAGKIS